jgi:hypothetical protein
MGLARECSTTPYPKKTVIHVALKADMTTLKAAPYQKFAPIFAPGGAVACDSAAKCKPPKPKGTSPLTILTEDIVPPDAGPDTKTTYSLQRGATFTTSGVPDSEHVYLVKFTGNSTVDQALAMTWTETGLLSTATATVTNRSTDIAMSGLKLVTGVVAKTVYAGRAIVTAPMTKCSFEYDGSPNDRWVVPILYSAAPALVANYCATKPQYRNALDSAMDERSLIRAIGEYNNKIIPLIKARDGAMNDRMGFDPIALITKFDGMIQDLLSTLYLGTTTTKTWEGTIDLTPGAETAATDLDVLRLDEDNGFCIDPLTVSPDSKPFPKGFPFSEKTVCSDSSPAHRVVLHVDLYPATGQLFRSAIRAKLDEGGERGFRYRIPAQVRADLRKKNASKPEDTFGSGVFSVAQKGYVASLPARRNDKMMSYDLAMVEATGALKTFKLASTGGLDAATIDALASSSGSILDARNAAAKQAKTDADELTTLTRQDQLLKLKDDICTLKKKYGIDCDVQP